jgi:hypothetical protein
MLRRQDSNLCPPKADIRPPKKKGNKKAEGKPSAYVAETGLEPVSA